MRIWIYGSFGEVRFLGVSRLLGRKQTRVSYSRVTYARVTELAEQTMRVTDFPPCSLLVTRVIHANFSLPA